MSYIATEPSVCILASAEPLDYLLYFLFGKTALERGDAVQRPIAACDLKMLSEIFADGI